MEEKKCPKDYWNKILLSLLIAAGGVVIFLYLVHRHSERAMMIPDMDGSTSPAIMVVNIKWQDSTCCVVLDDWSLLSILKEGGKKRTPQMQLPYNKLDKLSYRDTLVVDSLSFMQLQEYIVTPQQRIDSIYKKEKIEGLLSAYFDNNRWFIPYCSKDDMLPLIEQRYVIYLLLKYGYSANIDCESGCLYIER